MNFDKIVAVALCEEGIDSFACDEGVVGDEDLKAILMTDDEKEVRAEGFVKALGIEDKVRPIAVALTEDAIDDLNDGLPIDEVYEELRANLDGLGRAE